MAEIWVTDSQLRERFSVHRTTIWRWMKTDPRFPAAVKFSPQCTRWKLSEIEAWEAQRLICCN